MEEQVQQQLVEVEMEDLEPQRPRQSLEWVAVPATGVVAIAKVEAAEAQTAPSFQSHTCLLKAR